MAHYGTLDFNRPTTLRPLEALLAEHGVKLPERDRSALKFAEDLVDLTTKIVNAVRRFAVAAYAPVKAWRQALRTREELMALDDRTLADIGLARRDLSKVAEGVWAPENRSAHMIDLDARTTRAINANKPQAVA